ncbi:hypothetical protein DAEQUDRAFT_660542, partial [Daedalea quercina L-15889]
MVNIPYVSVLVARATKTSVTDPEEQPHHSFRAARLVGDSRRFLFVTFPREELDSWAIRSRLSRWIKNGLHLQDTQYAWLGYSDSHVKSGKVVLFREDMGWTVSRLLREIGDVRQVFVRHGYGKYAARLGLSFSSTIDALDIGDDRSVLLEDLRAPDTSLHTDGCGMIRRSLALKICKLLQIPKDTSVFQIRRGGTKGLLVCYPDEDFERLCNEENKLVDKATVIRKLLLDQLDLIGAIANDRDKALKAVGGDLDANSTAFHQDLYSMLLANHDLREPYVEWKLNGFQQMQYQTLREKLNVAVEDSAYVFGVVDEYAVLEPDEVFVNLPGRVGVITRPNVVVCRDLDGDEYLVSWDSDLVPQGAHCHEFEGRPPSATATGPTIPSRAELNMDKAAVDTFVEHHFNSLLGSMATEWKRLAICTRHLADEPYARKLQPLVESALDAMKSGTNMEVLKDQFQKVKREAQRAATNRPRDDFENPLEVLRKLIPTKNGEAQSADTEHVCDETLNIRHQDPETWDSHLDEAPEVMKLFNKELFGAIRRDQAWNNDKGKPRKRSPKHAEIVTLRYRERYFGGGTFAEMYMQRMRASAWYSYGYSQGKQAFAWLGLSYLNEIRSIWSNHNRPVLYVGSTTIPTGRDLAPSLSSQSISRESTLRSTASDSARSTILAHTVSESSRSVLTNPKPDCPVASQLPPCTTGGPHEGWRKAGNRHSRTYTCKTCGFKCQERKREDQWQGDPSWTSQPTASQSRVPTASSS